MTKSLPASYTFSLNVMALCRGIYIHTSVYEAAFPLHILVHIFYVCYVWITVDLL